MLRSLLSIPAIGLETATLGSAVLVTAPFTSKPHSAIMRAWARMVVDSAGIDLDARGGEGLDPGRKYIFVSNHQSLLDVPCQLCALPVPVRFVAKRSLFRVPIFGQALAALGTVPIDRSSTDKAIAELRRAQEKVAKRYSILFFPEGTRSADGSLGAFKKGAFVMALNLGMPIVPVAVDGTHRLLPKGAYALQPGRVRVRIGTPIESGPNTPERRDELLAQTHQAVQQLLSGD
jgi:1-acyl-sn-glycerol-3-phosphate acyltransferase